MVQTEEEFLTTAFWMLVLCCVRLIVYLRLHPRCSKRNHPGFPSFPCPPGPGQAAYLHMNV